MEACKTPAFMLAQDEFRSLRITPCFLFLKNSVKRPNKFPEIKLR